MVFLAAVVRTLSGSLQVKPACTWLLRSSHRVAWSQVRDSEVSCGPPNLGSGRGGKGARRLSGAKLGALEHVLERRRRTALCRHPGPRPLSPAVPVSRRLVCGYRRRRRRRCHCGIRATRGNLCPGPQDRGRGPRLLAAPTTPPWPVRSAMAATAPPARALLAVPIAGGRSGQPATTRTATPPWCPSHLAGADRPGPPGG